MKSFRLPLGLLLALLTGNAFLFYGPTDWLWLRLPAAIGLTFVLPGWPWLAAFNWAGTRQGVERVVLIFGLSLVLASLGLLGTVLLPGPFTEVPVLITLNALSLAGLIFYSLRLWTGRPQARERLRLEWPAHTTFILLTLIIVIGAFTRLTRLGYAEFHEDELENMRLIVSAYKGEEYAPFIDSKGPIHWLLPAALWYANGWLNETIARTPFALASLLLIPCMFSLGRRLSERDSVGLIAAGLVALNGFFVALARHVENRSLIVFLGAWAFWFAYRYYRENQPQFLIYLALILAVGLIAHPTVLLFLPVLGLAVGLGLWSGPRPWLWLGGSLSLLAALLALFYIPYFRSPEIGHIYEYFAGERIGTSLLYNRVGNMLEEDALYSSRYYAPVLIGLLAWLLARHFARWGRWGGLILGGLSAAIVLTVAAPNLWQIGPVNLAFIPYLLLTLLLLALPQTSIEIKLVAIWFAAPFGALLFMATDASNHIQIAYPGWSILAAWGLVDLWSILSPPGLARPWPQVAKVSLGLVLLGATLLSLSFQYLSFNALITTYWQAKADYTDNPRSVYKYLYGSIARPKRVISNPRLGGWKAVGVLWADGALQTDFRSINESFAVPIWYTFQTPRSCYDDPQNYWVQRDWQGWPAEADALESHGYTLTRVVLVDQQPKLRLYEKDASPREPEILDSEIYRHSFDRLATPARFAQSDRAEQPASLNFGDKLLLSGYNLPTVAHPGELLPVTVYWQSLSPMEVRYRAFVHLVDAQDGRWGQHDDDPACRLLTTDMYPNQQSSRQFRVPIDPQTPPGPYRVILGLYHPETLERLDIWDNLAQQSPGTSVTLGKVTVK
ncbi:MAG TPA: glycosyltransferase family 39 protein [Anaerolineae bacterium]|nr:glycosyltransferase family 39 protein [Anaerolineae bacterium]